MIKIISFLIFFLLSSSVSYAEVQVDDATQQVCNKAILSIYKDILQVKDKYQELSDLNENALFENKYGIYTISYQYKDPRIKNNKALYELLVTIVGMDDKPFKYAGFEDRHYGFPVIDLRISSFVRRDRRFHYFDIDKAVFKANEILYDYQQRFLPLQVILKSQKDRFKVGERIEFEVVIKNISSKSFKIKSLGQDSLFFTINNQEWGTRPSSSSTNSNKTVIPPNDSISRGFKGDSFATTGDVEIFCTYNVAYKGILPFGSLKVKIVE